MSIKFPRIILNLYRLTLFSWKEMENLWVYVEKFE